MRALRAAHPALVRPVYRRGRAGRVVRGIDRGTPGEEGHGLCRTAVVLQGAEDRVDVHEVSRFGEAEAGVGVPEEVVTSRVDRSVAVRPRVSRVRGEDR